MAAWLAQSDLPTLFLIGLALAALICAGGTALAREADRVAQHYDFTASLVGAVLLGATTSLPGTVVSVSAAFQGHADLAISNAIGGITAQTVFLAIADMAHRRKNLEHEAASVSTVMQSALLAIMLAVPIAAAHAPDWRIGHVHVFTPVLIFIYIAGIRLIDRAEARPLWRLAEEGPDYDRSRDGRPKEGKPNLVVLVAAAGATGLAGYLLGQTAIEISERTGVSLTALGVLATATATSLPELVTAVAAVRRGALGLAVGGIIGGNAYDVLFLSFSDLAYRPGVLFAEMSDQQLFILATGIVMSGVLLLGLMKREARGPANIGFESVGIIALYALSVIVLVT